MPDGNPIVDSAAHRADAGASPLKGAGLLDTAHGIAAHVDSGEWAQGLLVGGGLAALDVHSLLKDPIAKLASWGLSWIWEFFGPLNEVLDWLTGDDEHLDVTTETWNGIAAELRQAGQDLDAYYRADTAAWDGHGVLQYRQFCADRVELYTAAATTASSTASLINKCKIVLSVVRTVVRNLVTDGIGKAISIALRYPPPATFAAAPEVANQASDTARQVRGWVQRLKDAFTNAGRMLKDSGNLFARVRQIFQKADSYADAFQVSSARAAQYFNDGLRQGLDEVAEGVKQATKDGAHGVLDGLPGTAVKEVGKEAAKQGGAMVDDAVDGGEPMVVAPGSDARQGSYLDGGSGPHRTSGEVY